MYMSKTENYANQIDQAPFPRNKIHIHGVEFDEDFLSELVVKHLNEKHTTLRPKFSDAFKIYTSEFANYGSVGYTLAQKKAVIERILI